MAAPAAGSGAAPAARPSRSGCARAAVRPSPVATRRSAATGNRGTSPACRTGRTRTRSIRSTSRLRHAAAGRSPRRAAARSLARPHGAPPPAARPRAARTAERSARHQAPQHVVRTRLAPPRSRPAARGRLPPAAAPAASFSISKLRLGWSSARAVVVQSQGELVARPVPSAGGQQPRRLRTPAARSAAHSPGSLSTHSYRSASR